MKDFKLYLDKTLQIPAGDPIELGKLKAGETKKYKYYIYNSSVFPYEEIKYEFDANDVKVLKAPSELSEKGSTEFVIEWKPKVDVEKGLKTTLEIDGYRVIKG
jgi:hypothetical protein